MALGAVAEILVGVLTIFVGLLCIGVMYHKVGLDEFRSKVTRALFVMALSSPAVFNKLIVDFFQSGLPAFSMRATMGNMPAATVPQQFDQISQATENMIEAAKMLTAQGFIHGGWGAEAMSQRFEINLVGGCIAFILLICFIIVLTATVLTSLVLVVLSVTFAGWLFPRTEALADRAVSKLIGLALVMLICEIVVQQILIRNRLYLAEIGGTGQNVELVIAALWHIVQVFAFGLLELGAAVSIAVYIGGGVSFSAITPMVVMMRTAARAGGSAIPRRAR